MQPPTPARAPRSRLATAQLRRRRLAAVLRCAIALFVFTATAAAAPAEDGTLSLRDAVQRALDEGPTARIARLEAERAAAAAAAAQSVYLPRASVSSQAGYTNRLTDRLEAVDAEGNVREYGLGSIRSSEGWFNVMVHQVVFDLARWKQAERADLEAEVAALSESQRREVASYEVLEAYLGVLRTRQLLEYRRARIAEVEDLDERARSLLDTGRALDAERAEVALYLDEVKLQLLASEDEAVAARRSLAILLGDESVASAVALDTASVDALANEPAPEIDGVESSPEVRLVALRRTIEEVELEAARAGRYPVVALGGGYSHYGAYRYDNFPDELRIGIDFHMPLFEGFRHSRSIEGARKALAAAQVRHETLIDTKRARIDALTAAFAASQRAATLLGERERLGRERIRLATLAMDTQRGSLTVALAARREVDAVVDAGVSARYRPVLLWGELMREAGLLSTHLLGTGDADTSTP